MPRRQRCAFSVMTLSIRRSEAVTFGKKSTVEAIRSKNCDNAVRITSRFYIGNVHIFITRYCRSLFTVWKSARRAFVETSQRQPISNLVFCRRWNVMFSSWLLDKAEVNNTKLSASVLVQTHLHQHRIFNFSQIVFVYPINHGTSWLAHFKINIFTKSAAINLSR